MVENQRSLCRFLYLNNAFSQNLKWNLPEFAALQSNALLPMVLSIKMLQLLKF